MSINAAWNVVNFRAGLVRALVADGHDVVVAVPDDGALHRIAELGARVVPLPMASGSLSVMGDAVLLGRYVALMRRERPDVFLGWTIKPNIYGSLAARLCGIPAVNNISGLGTAFIHGRWLRLLARHLYRVGLRASATVFFQNADDMALFEQGGMVRRGQAGLLPGSGVDTGWFDPAGFARPDDRVFRFLMIARLIRDKGVLEFVEAAALLRARHPHVRWQVLGACGVDNRTAIDRAQVDRWVAQGLIDYLGEAQDVRPALAGADCVVLPSYREGLSRVLLESGAMERPAIASDVPGCRDAILPGRTGMLCRPRDAASLAQAMEAMLAMGEDRRRAMGRAARIHVGENFSQDLVVDAYRRAVKDALRGTA